MHSERQERKLRFSLPHPWDHMIAQMRHEIILLELEQAKTRKWKRKSEQRQWRMGLRYKVEERKRLDKNAAISNN